MKAGREKSHQAMAWKNAHIAKVKRMLRARPQQPAATAEAPKRKWKISAAARKLMADATKRR